MKTFQYDASGAVVAYEGKQLAALTSAAAAAPAGGTGLAAGAWDTAANRDLAITTINNLRTRVIELEARLQSLKIIP